MFEVKISFSFLRISSLRARRRTRLGRPPSSADGSVCCLSCYCPCVPSLSGSLSFSTVQREVVWVFLRFSSPRASMIPSKGNSTVVVHSRHLGTSMHTLRNLEGSLLTLTRPKCNFWFSLVSMLRWSRDPFYYINGAI